MQIEILQGDITELEVNAIVNAANSRLAGGAGVDGAIHRKGGPTIAKECTHIRNTQKGCVPGEAVITSGGNLKATYVIHTVGPIWNKDPYAEKTLTQCYYNSLILAQKQNITSIAFPNISTGVYGFPKECAAQTVKKLFDSIMTQPIQNTIFSSIERVLFCCFDTENFILYHTAFNS